MSFTQDELQAFNNILEQRLAVQRRELERVFELRLQMLQRDMNQRFTSMYQDLLRDLPMRLADQQQRMREIFSQQLSGQQSQQLEALQSNLAAWLQHMEQLIGRSDVAQAHEIHSVSGEVVGIGLEGAEEPFEITWEDLVGSLDRLMERRFSALFSSLQALLKDMEHNLAELLQHLREEFLSQQTPYSNAGSLVNMPEEVFASIEQLERIIESMQVAMAANHALLSNRLYYHRQLSCERAHPGRQSAGPNSPAANAKEESSE
jgi:hypothetical protein